MVNRALDRLAGMVPEKVCPVVSSRMPGWSVPRAVLKTMSLAIV